MQAEGAGDAVIRSVYSLVSATRAKVNGSLVHLLTFSPHTTLTLVSTTVGTDLGHTLIISVFWGRD